MAIDWLTTRPRGLKISYPFQISRMIPAAACFVSPHAARARGTSTVRGPYVSRTLEQMATRFW